MARYLQIHRATQDVSVLHDHIDTPAFGSLPVNALVLHAEQPVVVDTGLSTDDKNFVSELAEAIDPADVRWIWLTHPDRDHTGGILALLEAAPRARLVTTFALFSSDCFGAPLATADLAGSESLTTVPADDLRAAQLLWASIDSPWVRDVDRKRWPDRVGAMRSMGPSAIFSTHLPPAVGVPDAL